MACKKCSSHSCGGLCGTLSTFNWLKDIAPAPGYKQFECSEIAFKNSRCEFFYNDKINPNKGDVVVVEAEFGYDIGVVALTGEMARLQYKKKNKTTAIQTNHLKLLRYPDAKEIATWQDAQKQEEAILKKASSLASEMGLDMKIADVEYQADQLKLFFYFISENRIDFRELVKSIAKTYKVKIEMKQIGARQEASRIGGLGTCGRELCCSTWLTDFRVVSNSAARYQQLSINSEKLVGKCGKMKCCINFELEAYNEELKKFPSTKVKLKSKKGVAIFRKLDVFKGKMWYVYEKDPFNYMELDLIAVKEIIEANKKKELPEEIESYLEEQIGKEQIDFYNAEGQDNLSRFDKKNKKRRKKNNRKRKRPAN